MEEKILTPDQVAQILQIHPFTVLKFIKQGRLKASKLGRVYRIRSTDVEKFLDNQTSQTQAKGKSDLSGKSKNKPSPDQQALVVGDSEQVLPSQSGQIIPERHPHPIEEPDHYILG